nr:uncharacterized protein LOC112008289 [Quercus suber]
MAFQQLKEYLSRPPIMSSPEADEVLYAYIVVAPHAVSLVLIWDDNGLQKPIYYVSKSLHEAEVRYLPLEKARLAMVHATRKLPYYFQVHTMVVLTQLPLKSMLWTADYIGRIALWNTILRAFDIKYMPRTSIKGQVLADLVAKFAEPSVEIVTKGQNMDEKFVGVVSTPEPSCWKAKAFRRYYCELGITNRYSTPANPQGNRQAEAVKKVIVNGLKKRLDDAKGRWVEELPHVLWTYQTTPPRSTGETPFAMTYRAKAIILLEADFPMLRTVLSL